MNSTLTPEMNDRAREAAKRLVQKFQGNASAAAAAIDRSPGSFSRFLRGLEGSSYANATRLAQALGEDLNEMLGITAAPGTSIRNLPGFEKALTEARRFTVYSDDLWDAVGSMVMQPHPDTVDPQFLLRVAEILKDMRVKMMTSGSDTSPPSRPGGHKRSAGKIRTR